MPTATQSQASTQDTFLPELSSNEIQQLQRDLASYLNLPPYFSDALQGGGQGPEMAIIPTGKYEMGSHHSEFGHSREEYPQHYSSIQKPFAIGRFTITAEDFAIFQKDTEWYVRPELIWATDKQPMINIRVHDARLYLKWLSKQTGEVYRLPSEAEWEYAARAGTTSAFHFGDEVSCKDVHFHALFPYEEAKQKKRWYLPKCAPMASALDVGSKPPNSWGLHEVHGNVWEMTDTTWQDSHLNSNRDGTPNTHLISPWLVTKGGSWFDAAVHSRSAARKKRLYDEMDVNLGFRVVRELVDSCHNQ